MTTLEEIAAGKFEISIFSETLRAAKKTITILFTTSKFAPKAIQHTQKF